MAEKVYGIWGGDNAEWCADVTGRPLCSIHRSAAEATLMVLRKRDPRANDATVEIIGGDGRPESSPRLDRNDSAAYPWHCPECCADNAWDGTGVPVCSKCGDYLDRDRWTHKMLLVPADNWIRVENSLPNAWPVWICTADFSVGLGHYDRVNKQWYGDDPDLPRYGFEVILWKPILPRPWAPSRTAYSPPP